MHSAHLQPGDQIHHYIVEARVGGGGTATVYRVRHAILQHALALKVLNPEHVGRADLRQLFLAEGRIQAAVRHPAIVMVTDAVVDAPRRIAGLVMEYVEGPNLGELIARFTEPPPTDLVRSLAIPVLEALHHAHSEGIVHRDVKPSNVLLTRDTVGIWHPRVADFGIAYVLASGDVTQHRRIGTTAFMCPEQLDNAGAPTPQWDVFAFGCLLHELATGQHPFEGEDDEATIAAIRSGPPVNPRAIHPGLDPVLEQAILAALARDPSERTPDCGALLTLLLESSSDLPTRVAPAPPPSTAAPVPPTFLETPTGPEQHRRAWRIVSDRVRIGEADVEVALGPSTGLERHVHCELSWNGARWILEDRSQAGTRVNGARVTSIPLEDGDLLRLGHEVLKFHTKVPVLEPDAAPPRAPVVVRGPHLILPASLVGDEEDRVVPIHASQPLVLGRGPNADLVVNEPTAASRHCRIALQGLDVTIEDLGSLSGTFVNDQPVRFRRLEPGSGIRIGAGSTIKFRNG